jgi:sarcosine oxidase
VFTGVRAQSLHRGGSGWRLVTPAGEVRARAVVLATHTDDDQLWPGLAGSYYRLPLAMVATAPLAAAQAATLLPGGMPLADSSPYNLFWIMLDRDRRLVASLPPSLLQPDNPQRVAAPLQARLQRLFPGVGELPWDNTWTGWVDLVPDRLPRIFRPEPNLYAPLGYSGQGIVNATVLGRELGSAIAKDNLSDCAFAVTGIRPAPLAKLLPRLMQGVVFPLIRTGNRLLP